MHKLGHKIYNISFFKQPHVTDCSIRVFWLLLQIDRKELERRELSEDKAWHKPCPYPLEYTSTTVNTEESKICKL